MGTIGESVTEATVKTFNKKVGDTVNVDEIVVVVESDKGEAPVRSTHKGVITNFMFKEGDDVKIGTPVFELDTDGSGKASDSSKTEAKSEPKKEAPKTEKKEEPRREEPKREEPKKEEPHKEARETPKHEQKSESKSAEPKKEAPKSSEGTSKPAQSDTIKFTESVYTRQETREKMTRMRRTIGKRLKDSQNTYASITTFQEIDMKHVMDIRKDLGEEYAKRTGLKLGFMSFFLKAAARALVERPIVNAVIDDDKGEIVYRNYVDISVAVQAPKGLVVPVMRDVQKMTFYDCEYVKFISQRLLSHSERRPRMESLSLKRCLEELSLCQTVEYSAL